MNKDPFLFLLHIQEAIKAIESFCENLDEDAFVESILHQSAIVRQLEIIGEATKNIPMEFRIKYSQVAWKEIAGLRDVIIHSYFELDLNRIWNVIEKDIPILKEGIEKILEIENKK